MTKKCSTCQKFSRPLKRVDMPLKHILVDAQFMQWGLDVIGQINPKYSQCHSYILIATDYFTKWKESRTLKKEDTEELTLFIKENIFYHFGIA